MAKLYGWVGKILRVDLTTELVSELPTENYVPKFVGGMGVGAKICWDEISPEVEAFDPENRLIIMTGPTTGTLLSGKTCITGVSAVPWPEPLVLRSTFGGHWGPELKFAGYDGIIVQGKAARPVYLWIHDGKTEIRDASDLWGLDTKAAVENLWGRYGQKARVAVIGPAGENLVRDACIMTDSGNAAGSKSGFGSVMGSKNLKAIVVRGTGSIPIARPQELLEMVYSAQRLITRREDEEEPSSPSRGQRYWDAKPEGDKWGPSTSILYSALAEEAKAGTVRMGFTGCFSCPICCGLSIKILDGEYEGGGHWRCGELRQHESEQAYYGERSFRSRKAVGTWALADRLGLMVSQKSGLSNLPKLYEEGILTKEITGLPIDALGSVEYWRELLNMVAYRKGFGDVLAEGYVRLCNYLGTAETKTLAEIYMQQISPHSGMGEAKGNKLGAIHRITSNVLGQDSRGLYFYTYTPKNWIHPDILNMELADDPKVQHVIDVQSEKWYGSVKACDMSTWEYKAPTSRTIQNWRIMSDSLVTCCYNFPLTTSSYTPDFMGDISIERRLFSAVTGIDMTEAEWMKTADRIYMLQRAWLTRHGHTRENDWLFDSFIDKNKDYIDREGLSKTLDEYYELRGIDVATGLPKRSTLEKLDLKDIADGLEKGKYAVKLPV